MIEYPDRPLVRKVRDFKFRDLVFKIVPKPQNDEILSSWIARVAFAHKTYPVTFLNLYIFDNFFKASFDIDESVNKNTLLKLADKSGLTYDRLYNMALMSYEGYLFEESRINAGFYLIDPLKPDRKSNGLKFCPRCLKRDKVPYWRKSWRLSFYNVCTRHKVFMEDKCQQCGGRIIPLNMTNTDGLVFCQKCGFDLRLTKVRVLRRGYEFAQEAVKYFMKVLSDGKTTIDGIEMYSMLYFKVFARLTILMSSKAVLGLVKFPMHLAAKHMLANNMNRNDNRLPRVRSILYSAIYYLFEEFPENFVLFIMANNMMHFSMERDMVMVPFWYEGILDKYVPKLSMRGKEITVEEIESIKSYLTVHNMVYNKAELTKLIGCDMFHNCKLGYKHNRNKINPLNLYFEEKI